MTVEIVQHDQRSSRRSRECFLYADNLNSMAVPCAFKFCVSGDVESFQQTLSFTCNQLLLE